VTRYGFIAQELERILPSLVVSSNSDADDSGAKAVLYQDIIALLTRSVQEQRVEIRELKEGLSTATEALAMQSHDFERHKNVTNERLRYLEETLSHLVAREKIKTDSPQI
jgi:hypothetical protein